MSKTAASRIVGEEAVPLRRAVAEDEEMPTTVVEEDPVPLRLGADRVEAEERAARLRILTGRRSSWR